MKIFATTVMPFRSAASISRGGTRLFVLVYWCVVCGLLGYVYKVHYGDDFGTADLHIIQTNAETNCKRTMGAGNLYTAGLNGGVQPLLKRDLNRVTPNFPEEAVFQNNNTSLSLAGVVAAVESDMGLMLVLFTVLAVAIAEGQRGQLSDALSKDLGDWLGEVVLN